MKNYSFLFVLLLVVISCEKSTKEKSKIESQIFTNIKNDTIFIKEKCAVFIFGNDETIKKLKMIEGEENFYIEADDYNYYKYEARQFLEQKKLKIYNINDEKIIVFKSKKGDFTVLKDTINSIGITYLFIPNKLPKKVFDIDIESEYKNYFGKKDSLIFLKKEENVNFVYNAIACSCAQWSKLNDKKFTEKFYLIDEKKLTQEADDFWDGISLPLIVEATGVFSENQSVPKDFSPKGDSEKEKARIFKYKKIKLIQLGNKKY